MLSSNKGGKKTTDTADTNSKTTASTAMLAMNQDKSAVLENYDHYLSRNPGQAQGKKQHTPSHGISNYHSA